MNILIADDHAVVRRGIRQILAEQFPKAKIIEASNSFEALDHAKKKTFELVLLDLSMPGRPGFDLIKDLKAVCPDTPVLVLSMHSEDQFAMRTMKAGASGYINKESAPDELAKAINKVLSGGAYVSGALAESIATSLTSPSGQPAHATLSDREFQVLCRIGKGCTAGEIAAELGLSTKTVSTYRHRLLKKLNFHTNAELTRYAIQHGLA